MKNAKHAVYGHLVTLIWLSGCVAVMLAAVIVKGI